MLTNKWPLVRPNQIHVKNPKHPVAILTCWTEKELIVKELEDAGVDYNSVGQLYTVRGVSPLVRNMLANSYIKRLVIVGKDLGKVGYRLSFLWGAEGRTFPGCEDIPVDTQDLLRRDTDLFYANSVVKGLEEAMKYLESADRSLQNYEYPEPEPDIAVFPSADFGHCVTGRTIPETYLKMLQYVLRFGVETATHYEDPQKEVLAMQNVITAQPDLWGDRSNKFLEEVVIPDWMPENKEHLETYIKDRMLTGKRYEELKYTYGNLIHRFGNLKAGFINQYEAALDKMAQDTDQRSCVISLWDPLTHTAQKSGTPCLNHLQFRLRNGVLTMHAFIRSNDMYAGWPENAYALRVIQEQFAMRLIGRNVRDFKTMGPLCITSMSAHLYKDTWEPTQELVKIHLKEYSLNPWEDWDPKGQFNVRREDDKLFVELTSHGKVLQKWNGFNSCHLCNVIAQDIGTDNVSSAMWLARELQKLGGECKPYEPDQQCQDCESYNICWKV